ncbi:MAG: hypothetical protein HPY50_22325 [Firmicutes bacterium]|nr:hypothetical protein [Bacillota bacterium]
MLVMATFDYSYQLELAITDLEKRGIPRENIGGVPLDKRKEERRLLDTLHRADGISLFDGAAILGTIFMIMGAIYGFVLKWGPIIWGLIGLITGALLGFAIDFLVGKVRSHKNVKRSKDKSAEVILVIKCETGQYDMVQKVLWDNLAMGVGVFKLGEKIHK